MVKNTTGGSKTKGQGRKFITAPSSNRLRISESEEEIYAQVTAIFGNAMCEVICIDNKKRLCHIRGKFRGRGKRDNFINRGSWLLVGLREWESSEAKEAKGKLPNCDLLEVYNDSDKERLKNTIQINWSVFVENDSKNTNTEKVDVLIDFMDEKTEEYISLVELQTATSGKTIIIDDEEEVNVDDI